MPQITQTKEQELKNLLNRGDTLGATASAKTGVAYAPAYTQPSPTPLITSEGAIEATNITPAPQLNLPTPIAPATQTQFQLGLEASAANARETLDTTLKTQRDEAIKRQQESTKLLVEASGANNPQSRPTYAQEQRVNQNQLDAAERASRTIAEDFDNRRRIVGELETLLSQGNALLTQQQGLPVSQRVVQQRASRALQDIQARAVVLNATLSGIDGNISTAREIISAASGAIRASWQDTLNYNNTLLALIESGELSIEAEHEKYAQAQVSLAENELNRIDGTVDYIKQLMIDPETSQAIAQSGVTLNDDISTVNRKLAEYTEREEVQDFKNQLTAEGYEYVPFPSNTANLASFEVGGKTLYFKKPPVKTASGGSGAVQPGDNPQLYAGLTAQTATAVRARVNAFKSEPSVQNFVTLQEGYDFASNISDTTKNPADDQALIYALAKALDPGSVVREGEYATAQKYAQSWVKAYGTGVTQAIAGTGFLSRTARQNIKATIEQKYLSAEKSYTNTYQQYAKSISTLTGRNDGELFLSDYAINNNPLPEAESDEDKSAALDQLLGVQTPEPQQAGFFRRFLNIFGI
jgi:hypothetical protein